MAKARAIVKRRKAVRNIRKITKTMQMIATAKFQKSLKRAVGTKPYTMKVRELVAELAGSVGNVEHPLLRKPGVESEKSGKVAVLVITSNRGLAGAYNGSVMRAAQAFIRQTEAAGASVDLYTIGKKAANFFSFQKRTITRRSDAVDVPKYAEVEVLANELMDAFTAGKYDAVHVAYMNFISAGQQKPDVLTLVPLSSLSATADHIGKQTAEKESQAKAGALDTARSGAGVKAESVTSGSTIYEFSPDPKSLLDELLPLTVRTALFQAFLDATTSEHVARMIAMKSATDNADKAVKLLTMQYNRARQSQITTELSEIMGGVEAMKG